MKKLFTLFCVLTMSLSFTACSNAGGGQSSEANVSSEASISENNTAQNSEKQPDSETHLQIRIQTAENPPIVFVLNDSPAAKNLYAQLPLSIEVEDYAGSEKIFYLPNKLDTADTPMAEGPVGTLAYYAPWGNVAIFYGECGGARGLYELGEAISGTEFLKELKGEIRIESISKHGNSSSTSKSASQTPESISPANSNFSAVSSTSVYRPASASAQSKAPVVSSHPGTSSVSAPSMATTSSIPKSRSKPITPEEEDDDMSQIEIVVGSRTFSATLYENEATRALIKQFPMTLDLKELNGNEKYHYLNYSLPTAATRPAEIHAGDWMLFGSDCLVLFYESFSTSYNYTPLGRINNPQGLAAVLGDGSVLVTFRKAS